MILQGKIINSDASLNSFKVTGNQEFIPTAAFNVAFMLWNPELGIRYIPATTAVVTVTLATTEEDLDIECEFITEDDRSLISFDITSVQSESLQGGNIRFSVDVLGNGTEIIKGWIQGGLSRVVVGDSC